MLALVVLCSALLRFATVRSFEAPWIAPDEMVYGLVGRAFWATGRFTLLGHDAAGYGLFPVLAGLPPALFGTSVGITVLQAVQALLVRRLPPSCTRGCDPPQAARGRSVPRC